MCDETANRRVQYVAHEPTHSNGCVPLPKRFTDHPTVRRHLIRTNDSAHITLKRVKQKKGRLTKTKIQPPAKRTHKHM